MAKREIAWTSTAAKQRREILKYWTKKNKSSAFAEKLIEITKNHTDVILNNPKAFKESEIKNIHESAMGHFSIYYTFNAKQIIIMAFWDNRQDPKKLISQILKSPA